MERKGYWLFPVLLAGLFYLLHLGKSLIVPLVILLSLGLWGRLRGISGMFLCVPITAITVIILSHFPRTRPLAAALSCNGRLGVI